MTVKKKAAKKAVKKKIPESKCLLTTKQLEELNLQYDEYRDQYFVVGLGIFIKFPGYTKAHVIDQAVVRRAVYDAGQDSGMITGVVDFKEKLKDMLGVRECYGQCCQ